LIVQLDSSSIFFKILIKSLLPSRNERVFFCESDGRLDFLEILHSKTAFYDTWYIYDQVYLREKIYSWLLTQVEISFVLDGVELGMKLCREVFFSNIKLQAGLNFRKFFFKCDAFFSK
jgi:hypothetical protein